MIRSSQQSVQFTPSLNLDFRSGVMPAGLTFTRNSVGTYFDSAGVLQTAAANVPRIDYDPATLAIKGLLIEESRTNYIFNSEMVGAVVGTVGSGGVMPGNWSTSGTTTEILSVSTVAGMKVMRLRIQATGVSTGPSYPRFRFNSTSVSTNDSWSSTLYARVISISGSAVPMQLLFEEQNASTYQGTIVSLPVGGSLIKYTATRTITNTSTNGVVLMLGVNLPINGSTDCVVEIACPQVEKGSFATSYIPTTMLAAVTRLSEHYALPTGSWYNQSQGSIFVEFIPTQIGNIGVFSLNAGNGQNRIDLRTSGSQFIGVADSGQLGCFVGAFTLNGINKVGNSFIAGGSSLVKNGGTVNTANTAAIPTVTQLQIGGLDGNQFGLQLNGWISRLRYYPRRLANSFLQSLTA